MPPVLANLVVLHGVLSSEPRAQQLPSGDELINYEVTTPTADGRVGVPVVWFSPKRRPALSTGDEVVVIGLVRRRFFRAGAASASRTEVVATAVARAGSRSAERVLERASAALSELVA